jgi:hypothetical protein
MPSISAVSWRPLLQRVNLHCHAKLWPQLNDGFSQNPEALTLGVPLLFRIRRGIRYFGMRRGFAPFYWFFQRHLA